jgi:hypothetical protein
MQAAGHSGGDLPKFPKIAINKNMLTTSTIGVLEEPTQKSPLNNGNQRRFRHLLATVMVSGLTTNTAAIA